MSAAGEKVAMPLTPKDYVLVREHILSCESASLSHDYSCELIASFDALLTQRDALEAREKVLREALQAAHPLVQLVWARNPQQLVHREILAQVNSALATGAP